MRLAVVSDIHGNIVALEAVLVDIRLRAPDLVVNLGDCVTSPLWPRESLDLLESLEWPTVRGNHDRLIADGSPPASRSVQYSRDALTAGQRQSLGTLPVSLDLGDGVLAVHGRPGSDSEYLLEDNVGGRLALATSAVLGERLASVSAGLVLCGHSHHQHVTFAPGDRLVVNPGSIGCPRYADNEDPFIAEAGSPHARYAVLTRRGRRWSAELFALAYDWSAVVERAIANGRRDWAEGFLRSS